MNQEPKKQEQQKKSIKELNEEAIQEIMKNHNLTRERAEWWAKESGFM